MTPVLIGALVLMVLFPSGATAGLLFFAGIAAVLAGAMGRLPR